MPDSRILVVTLSDSFADLWPLLAADLRVPMETSAPGASDSPRAPSGAVIVAAGGMERQALDWLGSQGRSPSTPVYVVGSDPDRRTAVQFINAGASDYLVMPDDLELLRNALRQALVRQAEERARLGMGPGGPAGDPFGQIVGRSLPLRAALSRAVRLLPHADSTVLIVGETGTGKELLARAIHDGGRRRTGAFVAVNCSSLPANLIESELFGHERGAFTDAHAAKPGLFEAADGGSLMLDEIDSLPLALQAKLLRVLEDKSVRRVGGTRTRTLDVRIMAATHENLAQAVAAGRFREDLYFRLSVVTLSLPPLRERGDDVLVIAGEMLTRIAAQLGVPVPPIDDAVRRALLDHPWPGNVRELRNAIERALLLSAPGTLDVTELLPSHGVARGDAMAVPASGTLDEIASATARATLGRCGGNRSEAARRLKVSRQRLRRLLAEAASA